MNEGVGNESFFWENQSWVFPNSDTFNSGGPDDNSGPNTETPTGTDQVIAPIAGSGSGNNKKGMNGMKKKKGKGKGKEKGKESGDGISNEEEEEEEREKLGESSDHEMHIWTERERRKKMRNMFSNLHALLPQLPPKADKSTIVDEAVSYIKTLQQTLQKLQKQKLERFQTMSTTMNINNFDQSILMMTQQQNLAMNSTREAFLADQGSSTITPTNSSPNSLLIMPSRLINLPNVFKTWTSPNVVLSACGDQAHITVCLPKKTGILTALCYVLEKHKLEVVSAHVSSLPNHHLTIYMIQAQASGTLNQYLEAFQVEEIYKQAAGEIMFCISSSGLCQ